MKMRCLRATTLCGAKAKFCPVCTLIDGGGDQQQICLCFAWSVNPMCQIPELPSTSWPQIIGEMDLPYLDPLSFLGGQWLYILALTTYLDVFRKDRLCVWIKKKQEMNHLGRSSTSDGLSGRSGRFGKNRAEKRGESHRLGVWGLMGRDSSP